MKSFRYLLLLLLTGWTLIIIALLVIEVKDEQDRMHQFARIQARSNLNKDLSYRRWISGHGGVYVPVTEVFQPNPYLDVPKRDVTTTDGIPLTLVNPAYMTRLVHEQSSDLYGDKGHITSLNPIRPENAPKPWEKKVLEGFERGHAEYSEVIKDGTEEFFRMMIPLKTEASCLKCHGFQGYKEGDMRGGLSVEVSLKPYAQSYNAEVLQTTLFHSILWVLGALGLLTAGRSIQNHLKKRRESEEELKKTLEQKKLLLKELAHRTGNNLNSILGLLEMQAVQGENLQLKNAFSVVENRIRALSLVHRKIIESPDLSHINLGPYTRELVQNLLQQRPPGAPVVMINTQLSDVEVLIDSALPFGLIINEAVTNALDHGLKTSGGNLTLRLEKKPEGDIILEVGDDGPGLPSGLSPRDASSLGLSLIYLLGEQQLQGKVDYSPPPGTTLRLTFRDNLYQTRI